MSCFIAVVAVSVVMDPPSAGLVLCSITASIVSCIEENVVICAAGNTVFTSEVTSGTRVETTVCGMWGSGVIELVVTVSVDLLSSNVLCVMSSASVTGDAVEVSTAIVCSPEAIEDAWAAASVVSWIFTDLLWVELEVWRIATAVLCISGEISWIVVSLYTSVEVSWIVVSLFALVEVSWTVVSLFDAAEVSSKAVRLVACVVVTSCVVCAVVWYSKWSSQACKPSQEQVSALLWEGGSQSSFMVHVKPEREQEGTQSGPLSASTSLLFR